MTLVFLPESVKQPFNSKMADSLRSEKPKTKGRVCGQCENKAALLVGASDKSWEYSGCVHLLLPSLSSSLC